MAAPVPPGTGRPGLRLQAVHALTALVEHSDRSLPGWAGAISWLAGTLLLIGALILAVPVAAKALRPLKPLFVVHVSAKQESVLGKACKISDYPNVAAIINQTLLKDLSCRILE
mgnify:CR=1 FL=1